jgi:hypothetical protein
MIRSKKFSSKCLVVKVSKQKIFGEKSIVLYFNIRFILASLTAIGSLSAP